MTGYFDRIAKLLGVVIAGLLISLSGAGAQEVKQIKLTDAQVSNFIKAQSDLAAIASKIQAAGETADPALQAELEGIAKKHGFESFAELDDVAANISIVMAGLDTQTGEFTDPVEALQKELDDVKKEARAFPTPTRSSSSMNYQRRSRRRRPCRTRKTLKLSKRIALKLKKPCNSCERKVYAE